ncbi:MAG: thioredoxin family protein [Dehalococcoidaceae bacterium]|nr:thioredoxin family protein [Dehalococcoidaceae bacterium]
MKMKTAKLAIALVLALVLMTASASCQSSDSTGLSTISLEEALSNGRITLADFGSDSCIPCKMMEPILAGLITELEGKVNVVFIDVYDYIDLVEQHDIMYIPTQIIFDSSGQEIQRHMGVWSREDILTELELAGGY